MSMNKEQKMEFFKVFVEEFTRRRRAGYADAPDELLSILYRRVACKYFRKKAKHWRYIAMRILQTTWFKQWLWQRGIEYGKTLNGVPWIEMDDFRIVFYSEGQPNGRCGHLRRELGEEEVQGSKGRGKESSEGSEESSYDSFF